MIAPAAVLDQERSWRVATEATRRSFARFKPPERLSISEWAARYRVLPEETAQAGAWRNEEAPHLVGIMDAVLEPGVHTIAFQKCAQIGGTEVLLNTLGYFMHQDPSPTIFVTTNKEEAREFSEERLDTMIEACPELSSRLLTNTRMAKRFVGGGHLALAGANAPSRLRSRPRRVMLLDEVDGHPESAGEEGDVAELVWRRSRTYWDRVMVMLSTPTHEATSRIYRAIEQSDEVRIWVVPCPHCGHFQRLRFPQLRWDKDSSGNHLWQTASYVCRECGVAIQEREKNRMLAGGEWRPHRRASEEERQHLFPDALGPEEWVECDPHPNPRKVGFSGFSALSSIWGTWSDLAEKFIQVKDNPLQLQVFINTDLGEVFQEVGTSISASPLLQRREIYGSGEDEENPMPDGCLLLTCGVDVQDNRLELEVLGFGHDMETWSLDFYTIAGDPAQWGTGSVWQTLDHILGRKWHHPSGIKMRIYATAIDAGYLGQHVYKYAAERKQNNVWAVRGYDGFNRPIWSRATYRNKYNAAQYPVGVDVAKANFYALLRTRKPDDWEPGDPAPGYCHFPSRAPYDEEYFRQLTGERMVVRKGKRKFVTLPNRRVEKLDCRVYAMAAFEGAWLQGIRLDQIQEAIEAGPNAGNRERRVRENLE